MITSAFNFLIDTFTSCFTNLNFSITLGSYTFGFLDLLVVTTLLGIVVRNFVHSAK